MSHTFSALSGGFLALAATTHPGFAVGAAFFAVGGAILIYNNIQ